MVIELVAVALFGVLCFAVGYLYKQDVVDGLIQYIEYLEEEIGMML